ncbi:hypothetical protein LUZ60_017373 [Juncus effusus]|nr:hypothetical protein LUZ60_017373 [Juncus effusus]
MGCINSKIEDEEAVRRSKERRKLMKKLLTNRSHLSVAYFTYLKSLRDTGSTLRQFIEIEFISDPTKSPNSLNLPPSPPPLPPPPPPLQFSPIIKKNRVTGTDCTKDNSSEIDSNSETESCATTPRPPPPPPGSNWGIWDPFDPTPVTLNPASILGNSNNNNNYNVNISKKELEDEDWEETNTDFEEEEEIERVQIGREMQASKGRNLGMELGEDNISMLSWQTKESDMAMNTRGVLKSKKSFVEIIKEIDECFLKAAAAGKDVVSHLETDNSLSKSWEMDAKKGKNSKSAKVFSTLSFSRSFRSPLENSKSNSFSKSSATNFSHANTLLKLFEEEQKLYKQVKEQESAKLQYENYTVELRKLESGNHDLVQVERMKEKVEDLQIRAISLQDSVQSTSLSIALIRDEELFPQLIELSAGIAQMWREMHECHEAQAQVAHQARLLENRAGNDPTTDPLREAACQLETEIASWQNSFTDLISSQREYMQTLNQWIKLSESLSNSSSCIGIRALCDDLQGAFDKISENVAEESIKNFLSVIHSIISQQNEERRLRKKSDQLEAKLEKKLSSQETDATQTGKNQNTLSNEAKLDSYKKRVEEEKIKYLNSIRVSRAMTRNNLQTGLPNLFQALTSFAGLCVQAFEGINGSDESLVSAS